MSTESNALLLKFKEDTLATVSRATVKRMAKVLGFNETQVLHYALARLREELVAKRVRYADSENADEGYPPLTEEQLATIRAHAPRRRGEPLSSESLF